MSTRPNDDLETVLEGIEVAARRETEGSGEFEDPAIDVVLWGAGRLGRKTLAGLRLLGRDVVAFVDSSPVLQGTTVGGVPVLSPEDAARRHAGASFVVTIWSPGAGRTWDLPQVVLRRLGVPRVESFVPLFRRHPETFLPHYRVDSLASLAKAAPELRKAHALLRDEASRREFVAQVRFLANPDAEPAGLPNPAPAPTYFPADLFRVDSTERFVDAGAFDGDTLRTFLGLVPDGPARAWAFEPDPGTHERLRLWTRGLAERTRDRLVVLNAALGERPGTVRFDAEGTVGSSIRSDGALEVVCTTLDDEIGNDRVTFVKMDIEGAEVAALAGGDEVLRRDEPILAVCVYHLQSHLWEIPLRLAAISGGYQLFLRRYEDIWGDVVCYAVPPARLLGGPRS